MSMLSLHYHYTPKRRDLTPGKVAMRRRLMKFVGIFGSPPPLDRVFVHPPFDAIAFWSRHPSSPSAQDVIEASFLVRAVQPLRCSVHRYGYEKIKAAADGEGRRMHLLHTLLVHHFHPVNVTESTKTALHFLWRIFLRAQLPILDVLLRDQAIARDDH